MRVTGGELRGRVMATPRGDATRPTSERVREALFSILGEPPTNGAVLDLFCGGATLAIEALSRGIVRAVVVDAGRAAQKVAIANLSTLGLSDRCRLLRTRVAEALRALTNQAEPPQFDWVFVDPPYGSEHAEATLTTLGDGALLSEDAVVIIEHDKRRPPASEAGCLVRTDQRRYGDTELSIYRRAAGGSLSPTKSDE